MIYKTTNTITGRYYIGMHSTDKLNDGYLGSGRRLKYSVKKYGRDNHTVEILEHCSDRTSLIEKEKEIVNHDLIKDDNCMNLHTGGMCGPISNLGSKRSEETKKKMGAWVRTPEICKKISEGQKGWKQSEETKKKMSESRKGNIPWNKGKTGIYSEDTIEKIRKGAKGRTASDETKKKMSDSQLKRRKKNKE